jgi:hypothetical protein
MCISWISIWYYIINYKIIGSNGKCQLIYAKEDSHLETLIKLNTKPCVEALGFIWIWPGIKKL